MSNVAAERDPAEACPPPGFLPIPLATLGVSEALPVDLFLKMDKDQPPRLYRRSELSVSADDIARLVERGVDTVYIRTKQTANYQLLLRDNLEAFLLKDGIPAPRRYEFLSEIARDLLNEPFDDGSTDVLIESTRELGNWMTDMVVNNDLLASDVFSILRHDYKTFTHSFNTASFCLLLAKALGIGDVNELKEIALGALLHDVGKLGIPSEILNKKDRLTAQEYGVIQRHPGEGFIRLCDREDLSHGQLMMIYQHHERIDGGGYPVRESGNGIHHWARICSVVDVFEAMTSHRPYREAIPMPEVLDYLDQQAGSALDQEIVRCWKATAAAGL